MNMNDFVLNMAFWIENTMLKNLKFTIPIGSILCKHRALLEFFSFCIVGALGLMINLVIFTMLGASGYFAWFMGILTATISNFILNKYTVFNQKETDRKT